MNEINFNSEKNINPKQSSINGSKYADFKALYLGYTEKMDKSDFANSLTRCQIELEMLKDLQNFALQENKSDELAYIKERYSILSDKFKQFGIVLKDLEQS